MIYGRDELSIKNIKSNLENKENIKKNLTFLEENYWSVNLFVDTGRTKNKNSSFRQSRSKLKHSNLIYNVCKKKRHIKVNYFKLKNRLKKKKTYHNKSTPEEANIVDDEINELTFFSDVKHKFEMS